MRRWSDSRVRGILTDLLAGSTHAIQTAGEIHQSCDLPSAPPCTARSNVAVTWLLREASLCGTSESGNILETSFLPQMAFGLL